MDNEPTESNRPADWPDEPHEPVAEQPPAVPGLPPTPQPAAPATPQQQPWWYPTEQLPSMQPGASLPGQPGQPGQSPPASQAPLPPPPLPPYPPTAPSAQPADPQGFGFDPSTWSGPTAPPPGTWTTPGQPLPPPPSNRPGAGTILTAIVAGFLLIAIGASIGWVTGRDRGSTASPPVQGSGGGPLTQVPQTLPPSAQSGQSAQTVASSVTPAIVDVNTYTTRYGLSTGKMFALGAGTGMIVTSNGQVLTNNHVVKGANSIRVTIQGRSGTYKADVIGVDPTDDVALLQIEGVSGLPTVTLSDSSSLQLGQSVVAIGNALGKGGSPAVTQGAVTALGRSIHVSGENGDSESLSGLIQTNAAISPGDSGGALVNGSGQVIGMITAASTYRPNQEVSTIGYAIPVNNAVAVVNRIRSGDNAGGIIIGKAGFLGISVQDLTEQAASQLGLSGVSGVLVANVAPGGPAEKAGIPANSVITAVDGQTVTTFQDLGALLHRHAPGQQAQITYVDGNGSHTVSVTLTDGPAV
jgi:S1-C subfamily serine protease